MAEIPVNDEPFEVIRANDMMYVDKTEALVDLCSEVSRGGFPLHLYTRPSRFGKTMLQDTMDRFFNVAYAGNQDLFEGLEISRHREFDRLKNRFPVIRIDMQGVDASDEGSLLESLRETISETYSSIQSQYGSEWMSEETRRLFSEHISSVVPAGSVPFSILRLSGALSRELVGPDGELLNTKPVILMDEYDSFLNRLGSPLVFDHIASVLSNFMVLTFKTNRNRSLGVITGILTLADTGLISDLNNIVSHDIFDRRSARYFGYTEEEVDWILDTYLPPGADLGLVDANIKRAYNGYDFGGLSIYNPRSVNMYLRNEEFEDPPAVWTKRRENSVLDGLLSKAPEKVQDEIASLVLYKGRTKEMAIRPSTLYSDLLRDDRVCTRLYSYLVMTGYLKASVRRRMSNGSVLCDVSLPSNEMKNAYEDLLARVRERKAGGNRFFEALFSEDAEGATEGYNEHLKALSVDDPWKHDDCKKDLTNFLQNGFYRPATEIPKGNGKVDVFLDKDSNCLNHSFYIEITTSAEAGTSDLDRILDICWRKFDSRRYAEEDKDGVFVAFAWDRRFCKIGIRRYEDIKL